MINIPKNLIINNLYTPGNQFVFKDTNNPYTGYYFTINEKAFTGKTPASGSLPLEKISDRLLVIAKDYAVSKLTKFVFDPTTLIKNGDYATRYFVQKTNETPINISEVDKDTYNSLQKNAGYKTVSIKWDMLGSNQKEIDSKDKIFPGLKLFLEDTN